MLIIAVNFFNSDCNYVILADKNWQVLEGRISLDFFENFSSCCLKNRKTAFSIENGNKRKEIFSKLFICFFLNIGTEF